MNVFDLTREEGVRIEYADLGDWGFDKLCAEYDPAGPVIRLNVRWIGGLLPRETQRCVAFAVAHELYHHRERCSTVPRLRDRVARETAADEFASTLLASA